MCVSLQARLSVVALNTHNRSEYQNEGKTIRLSTAIPLPAGLVGDGDEFKLADRPWQIGLDLRLLLRKLTRAAYITTTALIPTWPTATW